MHRFYCPDSDFSSFQIKITQKDEIHHLCHVVRLTPGDNVVIFDGISKEAEGVILNITPLAVVVKINSIKEIKKESPSIILACAIPKKSKFEVIIEKATELGVDAIIPLKTQRTEFKLKKEAVAHKKCRYQTVAINAAKQAQRVSVPTIHDISDFSSAIEYLTKETVVLMPSLLGNRRNFYETMEVIKSPKIISICIGPEGDFTPEEYKHAHQMGCIPISLGKTVLKVETAAMCSMACVNTYWPRER